jgi:hypothetical protein
MYALFCLSSLWIFFIIYGNQIIFLVHNIQKLAPILNHLSQVFRLILCMYFLSLRLL